MTLADSGCAEDGDSSPLIRGQRGTLESFSPDFHTRLPGHKLCGHGYGVLPAPFSFLNDQEGLVGVGHRDARKGPGIVFTLLYSFEQFEN